MKTCAEYINDKYNLQQTINKISYRALFFEIKRSQNNTS